MKRNFIPINDMFQYTTSRDHKEDGDTAVMEKFLDAATDGQDFGQVCRLQARLRAELVEAEIGLSQQAWQLHRFSSPGGIPL